MDSTSIKFGLRALKASCLTHMPSRQSNLSFAAVHGVDYPDPIETFLLPVKNLVRARRFHEAVDLILSYKASELRSREGCPLGVMAAKELLSGFGSTPEDIDNNLVNLFYFETWAKREPDCPYAIGSYAGALSDTGFSYRGNGSAEDVTTEQFNTLLTYVAKAEAVLDQHPEFAAHPYIARMRLHLAMAGCRPVEDHWQRFHALISVARHDWSIYKIMAFHLLPKWFGSMEHIEQLARWSADATQETLGQSTYAAVWLDVHKHEDLTQAHMDWERLKTGMADWQKLHPSQYNATLAASLAFEVDDKDYCLKTLENLREFHSKAWYCAAKMERANSLCREFARPLAA